MSKKRPDEGRYSKVTRRIWNSADFRALSTPKPNAQSLFFRLLTGPELGIIPGLYEFRVAGTAEALNWTPSSLRKCLKEITDRGMAVHDSAAGVMWVPKAIIHNPPDNPNVIAGWKQTWKEIPACETKESARKTLREYCESRGAEWVKAFDRATGNVTHNVPPDPSINPSSNPSGKGYPQPPLQPSGNQEQEQEQEQEQDGGSPPNPPPPVAVGVDRDPDHDDLIAVNKIASDAGWMGVITASNRTKNQARKLIAHVKATAIVDWRDALKEIYVAWVKEPGQDHRIQLRNWPENLLEDWPRAVALAEQNPTAEVRS